MTHTPGPWKRQGWLIVNPQNDGLILDGRMKRPKSLFESFVWDSERSADEQTANIILAESVPELLKACKALLEAFEGYEMLAALDIAVQEQARVAIAKAEGEQ